ncbi:MAG TPA: hemin uptake protein HemP [Rhodanobacteraceae bacterium]|nr:hemin uptake protein HemP [Rhodanobacteraceae bacterium]
MLQSTLPAVESAFPTAQSTTSRPHAVAPRRRIDSARLLEGARELVIQHGDGEYHLRLTRNDKLILTK